MSCILQFCDCFYRRPWPMCTTGRPQGTPTEAPIRTIDRHETSKSSLSSRAWISRTLGESGDRHTQPVNGCSQDKEQMHRGTDPPYTEASSSCSLWRIDDVLQPTKDIKSPASLCSILLIKQIWYPSCIPTLSSFHTNFPRCASSIDQQSFISSIFPILLFNPFTQ